MAEVHITLSDGRKTSFKLAEEPMVLGRDAQCDVPIDDPSTSRRHARFSPAPGGYNVEDLGSKNGTLLNDLPCTGCKRLRDGDRVTLGSVQAVYHETPKTGGASVVVLDDPETSRATHYLSADKQLNLSAQRLQLIYELSERLTTLQSRDQLVENAMEVCFQTLYFERGAIGVKKPDQRTIDWLVVRNLHGGDGELAISRTLLARALQHGERAIFTDAGPGNVDPTVSMVQQGIRSAMCVPLTSHGKTIGVIYGDRVSTSTPYSDEDIDFLAGIAVQITIGLINCDFVEEQQKMAALQRDVELARKIQTGLFPRELPSRGDFRVAAVNDPGQRVSGDYYDVINMDEGRHWVLIADVTGEGVAASLIMANLQAAVRATIHAEDDPAKHLTRWNRLIYQNTDTSKFVTALLALVDVPAGRITVSTAGHCRPFLIRATDPVVESPEIESNFPLGVVEDAEFASTRIEVGREPYIYFVFTDGVIEAMNAAGEQYGLDRLSDNLTDEWAELNPVAVVKQVRKSVTTFAAGAPQSDDITILAARVSGASS